MASDDNSRGGRSQMTVLPNGLRVLTERIGHVDSVSLGVWMAVGSGDEQPGSEGITHFAEHMLFKGTDTRSAAELGEAIDDVGGHVNGFTEREWVCLYARTVADQMQEGLELLLDLLAHSVCPPEEIARERDVVLQEIRHLEDMPEGWVHELLPETAWPSHALGRPVTGTAESVGSIGRDSLLGHLSRLRAAGRIIVTAAGRLEHERIVEVAAGAAEELSPGDARPESGHPVFRPQRSLVTRPASQVHFCLGTPGCARADDSRHALAVLDTVLGGGSSSRLFREIREKRGLAYNIGSYLQSYRDAGLFVIDGSTTKDSFQLVLDLILQEVERLRGEGPSEHELRRAKTQLRTAMALAAESTSFRGQHLAGCEMYWGRVVPFEEIIAGVEAVTAEDVVELGRLAFTEERRALVAVGPFDE